MSGRLAGQVAVVTGASSGMGRATALAFCEEGAKVVAGARRLAELQSLADDAKALGGEIEIKETDVTRREDVEALVSIAVKRFGKLDVLIDAAGVNIPDRRLEVLTDEGWDKIIDINLKGAFYCTQAALPTMRQAKNGLIIYISSISGIWGDFSGAAYQASKHGMIGLAYATMVEERKNGIRTTLLMPGLCDTPILNNRPTPPSPELRAQMMKPEDIAQACVFVASLPARTYIPEMTLMPGALGCVGMAAI